MPIRKNTIATSEELLLSQRTAQRLVGDPEIISAFEQVRDAYLDIWAKTLPNEAEKRELAYCHYKAVSDVMAILQRKAKSAHVRDLKGQAEKDQPNG